MKPKLKAVNMFKKSDDSWQHCCRWCHYYEDGKCYNKDLSIVQDGDSDILYAADMGEFSEVIEEAMMYPNTSTDILTKGFYELFDKWKISNKKREDFSEVFEDIYNEFVQEIRSDIDEAILRKMRNILNVKEYNTGAEIDNPSEFVCKYWE